MNSIRWNSKKDDINFETEARTQELIDQLKKYHEGNRDLQTQSGHYNKLVQNLNKIEPELKKQDSSVEFNIDKFIYYLGIHPDMLQYEFDRDGNLVKIIVDPFRLFTFKNRSKERQCNMSYGIKELLNAYCKDNSKDNEIEVVMGNQSHCESQGFILLSTSDTISKSVEPVGSDGPNGDTAGSAGGSPKSKTHRRRRHSRVRKHKKNTYTRRR